MPIVVAVLFSLTLASSPLETEFLDAFRASDVGRLMRLWDPGSPTRHTDRLLFTDLITDGATPRIVTSDGKLLLELHDRQGTLLDRYELQVRDSRVWSLVPVESADPVVAAHALLHRGAVHFESGALDEAEPLFQRAAELADGTTHLPTRAAAQRALGYLASNRGDVDTALRHFEGAMTHSRATNDRREIARSLDRLALIDRMKGDNARAEEQWLQVLQTFRDAGDRILTARTLNVLGNLQGSQGKYDAAIRYFEDSLRIYEILGDPMGMSIVLNNLATDTRGQGDYRKATALFRRTIELGRSIDDELTVAYALGNLGNTLALQGQYVEALNTLRQSLELFQRLNAGPDALSTLYLGLGELYRGLGDFEQARAHAEAGLAYAEQSGWKDNLPVALHSLANTYQRSDPKRAIELYEKAMAIDTELGNRAGVAFDLHSLGLARIRAGDPAAARRSFEQSLAVAEEIGSRETTVLSLGELADLVTDPAEALAFAERTHTLATEFGIDDWLWASHTILARVHRRAGRLDEARREAERGVALVEKIRRDLPGENLTQHKFESLVRAHHELIHIAVEQRDFTTALENAERAKARVLLDVLQNGRPEVHAVITAAERERETALAAQVVQANNAVAGGNADTAALERRRKVRLEYDAYLSTLYAAHPQLRRERGEMSPVRADEIEALLAGGAADAVLEYVVAEAQTFVFSITRAKQGLDVRVQTIGMTGEALEAEVRRFRELLAGRNVAYAAAARALYDKLVAPVAAQLRGRATICIVPDGPLWELPFQALQPAPAEFLLDRHTLYSVPSLTVLRDVSRRGAPAPPAQARLLAFGNPLVPETPLPQSETEVRRIAALYGAARSRVHLGADAREEAVKAEAGGYDVLHFATHGVLDDHNALYSRLVFSTPHAEGEDGQLEAREIMRLDLHARLAVLSACDTGRGRVGSGEGMIGMTWALFVAGVPTSVVSQWKVDSQSTAELMVELHRALRSSRGTTVAQALRRAALATRANPRYRHPFYWAPFVVVGSP
jgi:CHAT domain-containing protein/tetratricopeptide (TPR) repeat protein